MWPLGFYRGYIGILENKMETTIMGSTSGVGFRVLNLQSKTLNPKP